jgi:hypothetical protein
MRARMRPTVEAITVLTTIAGMTLSGAFAAAGLLP